MKQVKFGKLTISWGKMPEPEPTVPARQTGAIMAMAGVDLEDLKETCQIKTEMADEAIAQAKADKAEAQAAYLATVSAAQKKMDAEEAVAETKMAKANEAKVQPTLALKGLEAMMAS